MKAVIHERRTLRCRRPKRIWRRCRHTDSPFKNIVLKLHQPGKLERLYGALDGLRIRFLKEWGPPVLWRGWEKLGRGKGKPGYHNGGATNVPKHRCAAGIAPRNLLFPEWLPGTRNTLRQGWSHVNRTALIDCTNQRKTPSVRALSIARSRRASS